MKKTVYVLGNPLIPQDRLPIKLLPQLKKYCPQIDFKLLDPTEELPIENTREIVLIDTVISLKKVTIFHDLSYFALSPRVTAHDFDLPLNLGILEKLGKIKNITIIGVPPKGNESQILKEIIDVLYIHLTFKK